MVNILGKTKNPINFTLLGPVHFHVDPSVWRDGRVDPGLLDPVCRLSGSGYASLGAIFKLPRPKWADVDGSSGLERMPRRS